MENDRNNRNDRRGDGHNNAAINHIIDAATLQTARTCAEVPLEDLQVIPMKTCQSVEYFIHPKMCEHKGVLAVMISLRTAKNDKTTALITQGGAKFTTGQGANSRFRLNNTYNAARYDRIVHFADCSSTHGDVFACMLETNKQSVNFFRSLRVGQEGIGDLILLEEVYPVDDTLGSTTNVPLVKRCGHVLPLDGQMATLVPEVPLVAPAVGDTRYFCQHGVHALEFGHVSIQTAICGGKLW